MLVFGELLVIDENVKFGISSELGSRVLLITNLKLSPPSHSESMVLMKKCELFHSLTLPSLSRVFALQ